MDKTEMTNLKKTQPPLMSRFIVFSVVLLLVILIFGIFAFVLSMQNIVRVKNGSELTKMLEIERIKLETSVNNEIVIALKMANSPLIKHFFLNHDDTDLKKVALDEIFAYRSAFKSGSVFWVNDVEKIFHFNDNAPYLLDPDSPENYWYNMTLYKTEIYNFNINYNPDLNLTNLWVNVPVFDDNRNPIGMLGTGIDLSVYLSTLYKKNEGIANIYFFNSSGEITGASDGNLVDQKTKINDELSSAGADISSLANTINEGETITLYTPRGVVVLGAVPLLEWYSVAVLNDGINDFNNPMTVLFIVTLVVIILIIIVFNIFIARLLVPLRRSMIEIESANQAKSSFLSRMSHEIRTPMNAILGITEIQLQNNTLETKVKEAFDKIYVSGDLLLRIINDILDFSKIEAGRLEIENVKYDVASLINDTAQLNMMRIGTKSIEFELDVDENLPAMLFGDELRIKQIMNNILSNAFKYTESGMVRFSVSSKNNEKDPEKILLIISVSDTGQGLTKEQIDMLFVEYARFNTENNRLTEGTGLGMSITHNLVSLMKGDIRIESEPGKGSTFTVTLPQTMADSRVLGSVTVKNLRQLNASNTIHKKREQITFTPMPYGSVLIVDDVATNIYVAKGLLAPYELSVDSATSGNEAIKKIEDGNLYDIIFMDHMMPGMDGIETTKKLRQMGYSQTIVALTANAVTGQSDIFLNNGFNDFIPKPIDVRLLNAALNKYIRDKQSPGVSGAKSAQLRNTAKSNGQPSSSTKFREAFTRDAIKALAALEELILKDEYSEEEMRSYTITVHGHTCPKQLKTA